MTLKLQIIIVILSLSLFFFIINMIINRKISLKYSLSWLVSLTMIFFMALFPNIVNLISEFLGIQNPINSLFFLGFVFVLIILYSNTVAQSRMSEKIKLMAQDIAVDNYKKTTNNFKK